MTTPAKIGKKNERIVVARTSASLLMSAMSSSQTGANSAILVSMTGYKRSISSSAAPACQYRLLAAKQAKANGNRAFEAIQVAYRREAGNATSARYLYISERSTSLRW